MTQITQVACDECGKDLTYKSNSMEWRIVLGSEDKAPWYLKEGRDGGMMTAMYEPAPFPRKKHFCDERCLVAWVKKTYQLVADPSVAGPTVLRF